MIAILLILVAFGLGAVRTALADENFNVGRLRGDIAGVHW